jgi:DNA-binding beta-propeller fold protein YncE
MTRRTVSATRPAQGRRGVAAAALLAGLLLSSLIVAAAPAAAGAGPAAASTTQKTTYEVPSVRAEGGVSFVEQGGVRVTFRARPLEAAPPSSVLKAGEEAVVGFEVVDTSTRTPIRGLRPLAWMARRGPGREAAAGAECLDAVRKYASGGLSAAATVDLNQFYVWSLNRDRSITIVNPLVSFSRTKLLGIVTLPDDAADWALVPSRSEILVTLPARGSLFRIDARTRRPAGEIAVGGRPGRILLLDKAGVAWVGDEASGEVAAIRLAEGAVAARHALGPGRVLLAASQDGARVFAASSGRLALLDGRDLGLLRSVDLPFRPAALAASDLAGAVLAASEETGTVRIHEAATLALRSEAALKPGLADLAVTPDGRWALAANRRASTVEVLDLSAGAPARSLDVEPEPDRIVFSTVFAYVRSLGSPRATLIPWTDLGKPGSLPVVTIPFGQEPPGDAAAGIAAAPFDEVPGGGAVVAASRSDKAIYYYSEGMMAPMGSFQNTSREPLAVMVVDGSLREEAPGLYATEVSLPEAGAYDVPFLLENPRMAGCFSVEAEAPAGGAAPGGGPLVAAALMPFERLEAGRPARLAYRITNPATGAPLRGLADVGILAFQPPGLFQARLDAAERGDGVYEASVVFPEEGEYLVLVSCPSRGAAYGDLPHERLTVAGPSRAAAAAKEDTP